jgi:hypothetical protein
MRMAKALIAAALLAAALVGAVVVPAALTRGTFAFDAWPSAPSSHAHDEQVAIVPEPSAGRTRSIARADSHPQPVRVATAAPGPSADAAVERPAAPPVAVTPRPHSSAPVQQPRSSEPAGTDPAPAAAGPEPEQELAEGGDASAAETQVEARPVAEDTPDVATPEMVPEPIKPALPAVPDIDPPVGRVPPLPGWRGRGRSPHGHRHGMK